MLQDNSEQQFILAAKNGSLNAFEQLVFAYEGRIFNHIRRLINSTTDAEDITQEVFIKAYKSASKIDLSKKFSSWLYKIATNTAYDWLRGKQRKPELFIIDDPDSGFETIDEHAAYYYIEDSVDIETALKDIKPAYKNALLMFYKEGFTYDEIASTLDIPINTVKTYLRRAKESIRKYLE